MKTKILKGAKAMSQAFKDKADAQRGKHLSQATKDKISAAKKGKHPSKEMLKHMSIAHLGQQVSPETRAKISKTMHLYRLAHPEFAPARGCKRSKKERRRQRIFMTGNQYAYKPYLHMSQEEMKAGYDAYVKEHGEKPYPKVMTKEEIQALIVRPKIMPKPVGNPAHPSRKDKK
jgi:hypothetical protein